MLKNLFLNTLRSLKQNKINVVGLIFLTFLSTGIYTVLTSTTTNISGEYNSIVKDGNLHDFTVSEYYPTAEVKYTYYGSLDTDPDDWGTCQASPTDTTTVAMPWPTQTVDQGTVTRTYKLTLDIDSSDTSSELYQFYQANKNPEDQYYKFVCPTVTLSSDKEWTWFPSGDVPHTIPAASATYAGDGTDANPSISAALSTDWNAMLISANPMAINDYVVFVNDLISNFPTGMQEYLTNNNIEYKKCRSIYLDNVPDGNLYRIAAVDPNDTIDKITLFNQSFKNVGQTVFSTRNYRPSLAMPDGYNYPADYNYNEILGHDISSAWDPHQLDADIIIAKFIILDSVGKWTADVNTDPHKTVHTLATADPAGSDFRSAYSNYYTKYSQAANPASQTPEQRYDRGYQYTIQWPTLIPMSVTVSDWTSNFAVVSPTYMQKHGLKPMDYSIFPQDSNVDTRQKAINYLNSLSSDSYLQWFKGVVNSHPDMIIANAAGTPFIITGAGITPDYIYPIINLDLPVPNPNKEAIIFANDHGYDAVLDSYRSNPVEAYLAGKVPSNVDKYTFIDSLNVEARKEMIWPSNVNAAYLANDKSNVLDTSAQRVAYIPELVQSISSIDYILTIFVLLLSILICAIVIRRYVGNSSRTIGVMQANGVGKSKIALSMAPFVLIPTLAGGIGGYLAGTFLQAATLQLFKGYWLIPSPLLAFSWTSLLLTFVVPFVILMVVAFIATLIVLRRKTTDLMKTGSEFKTNWLSRYVKTPISKLSIITRFRISIAFNSLWRLLILCIMTALAMSSLIFGLAINHKFVDSKDATFAAHHYSYAVDLATPTDQGGQYLPTNANLFGASGYVDSVEGRNFIPNLYTNDSNVCPSELSNTYFWKTYSKGTVVVLFHYDVGAMLPQMKDINNVYHANVFYPNYGDSTGQSQDITYMKNRVMAKSIVDLQIGSSILGKTDPWNIAVALMPMNNRNICDSRTTHIGDEIGKQVNSDDPYTPNPVFPSSSYSKYFDKNTEPDGSISYKFNGKMADGGITDTVLQPDKEFIQLITDLYSQFNTLPDNIPTVDQDYFIQYNTVPLENDDETYTYLNCTNQKTNNDVKVIGIKQNTDYVSLVNNKGNNVINEIKASAKDLDKNIAHPIVINALVAKKYHLHVGDEMSLTINNTTSRYSNQMYNVDNPTAKFKVVDIFNTYTSEEYYIDQDLANYLLGLKTHLEDDSIRTSLPSNNYINSSQVIDNGNCVINDLNDSTLFPDNQFTPYGFNGVFTKKTNGGQLLNGGVSLYSLSGIWPGNDQIKADAVRSCLNATVHGRAGLNVEVANRLCGFYTDSQHTDFGQQIHDAYNNNQDLTQFTDQLITAISQLFGNTAVVSLVNNVVDHNASEKVFDSVASTVTQIETTVLIVIAAMIVVIVALITTLIISESKRLAAMMKALGYRDHENANSFLAIYIPVILLGLAIAIPLSIGIVATFQMLVLTGTGILLTTTIQWWYFLVALATVGVIFVISGFGGYWSLKRDHLVDMIK